MSLNDIKRLYSVVDNSLFMTTGKLDYDRVTDAIIALSNAINECDDDSESIWYIDAGGSCDISELIVGAYWHYTEWHAGQWSRGYAALSALGQVFNPGMSVPESDNEAYIALQGMAS